MVSLARLIAHKLRDHYRWRVFKRGLPIQMVRLQMLRGGAKGRKLFILATGPSIKGQLIDRLQGEVVLSCSNAFLHPAISVICPQFHFFAPYHQPLVEENWLVWLGQAHKALPVSTIFVLGSMDRVRVERSGVLGGREVVYLFLSSRAAVRGDCLGPIPTPQSVPLMALPFALHLQPRRVILLGCDHTTMRNYGGTIDHFYPPQADLRINASRDRVWTGIEAELRANQNLFVQYRAYHDWLNAHNGTQVENGSPDSWLEIFPRVDLKTECGI